MRRNRVVLATAGLVLGAAVLAWGGGAQERPTLLTAAHPGAPGSAGTQAPDDQERRARRAALRTCLQQAGEDRTARRACFARAGAGAGAAAADGQHRRRPDALHHGLPRLLGRAVHGTVIVPNGTGGFEEVTFDRGRVDAATDAGRIVLDRPDGPEVTVALTPDTKYHGIDNAGALVDGRPALVVSRDGKALHVVQKVARPTGEGGKDGGNNRAPPVVPND